MRHAALVVLLLGACKPRPIVNDSGEVRTLPSGTVPGTPSGTTSQSDCALAGYEAATTGKSGAELWNSLETLTASHTCASYTEETIFMFTRLDKVNNEVECVYTGRKTPVTTNKPAEDDMNTEHSWPQSEGADTNPARCDLHHLYPTDSDANSARGNVPFGIVTGSSSFSEGGSRLGQGSGGTVFEPRDAHKGNVARSMLYFAARYGYTLSGAELSLYQSWHAVDPIDTVELDRTWAIADRQNIANPLVVCPELVDRL